MTSVKAYSYVRFSTPEQAQGDSERRQMEAAHDYAVTHHLELDDSLNLSDKGVSAYHGKNNEQGMLGKFLEAVRAGVVSKGSYLLVESIDRISRQDPWVALDTLKAIIDEGLLLVTLNDRRTYSREVMRRDLSALFYLTAIMSRAHEESKTKSTRVGAAWSSKRKQGKPMTSICPAWLKARPDRSGYDVIPARAEVVRRIYAMYLSGIGLDGIARTLNTEGVPPWGNNRADASYWHRSYIFKILDTPAVIGTLIPHIDTRTDGGKRVRKPLPDQAMKIYPAVIDEETWQSVQAMRSKKGPRGRRAPRSHSNLFATLLRCPRCGGAMFVENKGNHKGRPQRYVVCAAADAKIECVPQRTRYDRLEAAFFNHWQEMLNFMPMGDATAELEEQLARTEAGIEAMRDRAVKVSRAIARSGPSVRLTEELRDTESEIEVAQEHARDLEARIYAASSKIVQRKRDDLWEALTADTPDRAEINALLRQLVAGIAVDADNGEMLVDWAHGGQSRVRFAFPADE
jgi:DNA invertase Pin-like site-specific DNA recombinase